MGNSHKPAGANNDAPAHRQSGIDANEAEQMKEVIHASASNLTIRPISPFGRTNKNNVSNKNVAASCHRAEKYQVTSALARPRSRPPITDPRKLYRPPMIVATTANRTAVNP